MIILCISLYDIYIYMYIYIEYHRVIYIITHVFSAHRFNWFLLGVPAREEPEAQQGAD